MIDKTIVSLSEHLKFRVSLILILQVSILFSHIIIIEGLITLLLSQELRIRLLIALGLKMVLSLMLSMVRTKISIRNKEELRMKLFHKMNENLLASSDMVQMNTEAVDHIDLYLTQYIPQFAYALLAPIILFIYISRMNLTVALVLLGLVPMIPLSIVMVQKFAKRLLNLHYSAYLNLGSQFIQRIEGLSTFKMFDVDEQEQTNMDLEAEQFRKSTMRVLMMQLNSISVMDLFAYGGAAVAIIIIVGSYSSQHISLGVALVMILLSAEYFIPMRILGSFFHVSMNGVSAALVVDEYLKQELTEVQGVNEVTLSLKNISFSYSEKPILNDISLEIEKGQFIGISGMSGCGKTTLLNIISQRQSHSIKTYSAQYLKDHAVFINSQAVLFKGTLKDNLLMGNPNATDVELNRLLKRLNLEDLDLDYQIDPNASNLSGGQKQRISFARAILKNPELLFLDEVTSQIDSDSEAIMFEVISELHQEGKTILMISHRITNYKNCDHIIVLDQGFIETAGTYDFISEKSAVFKTLLASQIPFEGELHGNH